MRAALYLRVSTDEQAREGLSLSMQEEACRRAALAAGDPATETFSDPGLSGTDLNRPALQDLLSRLPEFDSLWVYRMDRLARRLRDRLALLDACMEAGVSVHSLTERIDLDTIMGRAMVQMMGVFAEMEVETLRERVRDALAHRVDVLRLPHGPAPYGYLRLVRGGDYSPHPEEAPWVAEIYRRYAGGESLYEITRALNAAGAPTKRNGGGWVDSTVRGILASPVYAGDRMWHGDTLPGDHPPLVERSTWAQAQERLAANLAVPPASRRASLAPLFRCGYCGGPIVKAGQARDDDGRGYRDHGGYRCSARYSQPHDQRHTPNVCSAPPTEEAIWRYASWYLGGALEEALALGQARRRQAAAEAGLPGLRKRLREIEQRQSRLLRGYSLGNMGEEVFEREAAPLALERERLLSALAATDTPPEWKELRKLAALADPARALSRARAQPADRQVAFLRYLFPRIDLYPRRLVVHHAAEDPPAELALPRRYQPRYGVGIFLRDGQPLP